jgi:hypothetical protein
MLYWNYINPSLELRSTMSFGVQGIGTTTVKYLKKNGIPQSYVNKLLCNEALQPKVLYTIRSIKELDLGTAIVALVYSDSASSTAAIQEKVSESLGYLISTYSLFNFKMGNGKEVLCHQYVVLKNKKTAYNIRTYYVQWNASQVISLTVIDDSEQPRHHLLQYEQQALLPDMLNAI